MMKKIKVSKQADALEKPIDQGNNEKIQNNRLRVYNMTPEKQLKPKDKYGME